MMILGKRCFLAFIILTTLGACQYLESYNKNTKDDKLLADVYGKPLYISDLDGMIPEGTPSSDSIAIVDEYVNQWVREALMMNEAENNIPKDLNIDKLVRDYRSSLVQLNYERMLVEKQLDSLVTADELQNYYEKNKEQYQLETTLIRCYFVKLPRSTADVENFEKWWKNRTKENMEKLVQYCPSHAKIYLLDDTRWYRINDIAPELPQGTLSEDNVGSKREVTLKNDDYLYYLKIIEVKNKRGTPPLSYFKEEALKFILHQRKQKLIEDKKQELYNIEMKSNTSKVKIYTK